MNVKKFDATHIKTLRQTMTKSRYTLSEDTTHIEIQPTPIRFGFSLAEVLITLGIIGVVAAMTMPNSNIAKEKLDAVIDRYLGSELLYIRATQNQQPIIFLLQEQQRNY